MAEHRPGGEPTEPPTEKRLRDARRRGEVPRSREVTAVAVFLAAAAVLAATWRTLCGELEAFLGSSLRSAATGSIAPSAALQHGLHVMVLAVAPILLVAMGAALLAGVAQAGPIFSWHGIQPELGRLSPARNLPRIFGRAAVVELLKNLFKLVGIGYLGATALRDKLPALLIPRRSPSETLTAVADCLGTIVVRVGIFLVVLAAADLLYERRSFFKRMRMTKLEVQREMKESEGDPHHKAERKRVHQEILAHEMIEGVASADCVVINPEHVAVAIRYDADSMEAPRVVASGRRLLAARIREIARQKGIPIVRNVPLARALVEIELDQEIPAELYQAVAEVLRFVYGLTQPAPSHSRKPGGLRGRPV